MLWHLWACMRAFVRVCVCACAHECEMSVQCARENVDWSCSSGHFLIVYQYDNRIKNFPSISSVYTYESHYPSNVFAPSNLKLQLWVPIPLLSPPFWRYVPEAVLFPTDPNFLQFHKVFEAFQVRSCPYISLYASLCRKSQYRVSIEVVVNNVTFIGSRFSSTSLWLIDSISFLSWLHVVIATCFLYGVLGNTDTGFGHYGNMCHAYMCGSWDKPLKVYVHALFCHGNTSQWRWP